MARSLTAANVMSELRRIPWLWDWTLPFSKLVWSRYGAITPGQTNWTLEVKSAWYGSAGVSAPYSSCFHLHLSFSFICCVWHNFCFVLYLGVSIRSLPALMCWGQGAQRPTAKYSLMQKFRHPFKNSTFYILKNDIHIYRLSGTWKKGQFYQETRRHIYFLFHKLN